MSVPEKSNIKILFVTSGYPSKDEPYSCIFTHEQAKALKKKSCEITILHIGAKEMIVENYDGIRVIRCGSTTSNFLQKLRKTKFALSKIFFSNANFIVFNFFVWQYLPLVIFSKLLGKKIVFICHGDDTYIRKKNPGIELCRRIMGKFIDIVWAVSHDTAHNMETYVSKKKIFCIPNGCSLEKFSSVLNSKKDESRKYLGLSPDMKILLSVCHLEKRKGLDILLKAVSMVLKSHKIYHIIIGEGPEKENLEALIKQLCIQQNVIIISKVSNEDLGHYYNACDIFSIISKKFVYPPSGEGFGIVYIEAGLFKKPVIGGKSGGVTTAVIDGVTGFLVDPEDKDAETKIARLIINLLDNPNLCEQIGDAARKRILEELTWDINAQKCLDTLHHY